MGCNVEANESVDNVFKFLLPNLFEPGAGRTKSVGIYDSGRFDVTPRCQISFACALKIHQFHSAHDNAFCDRINCRGYASRFNI